MVRGTPRSLLKDRSAGVRREVLLSLRDLDPAKAKPLILELARQYDGKDRFYLEAIGIAVGHHDRSPVCHPLHLHHLPGPLRLAVAALPSRQLFLHCSPELCIQLVPRIGHGLIADCLTGACPVFRRWRLWGSPRSACGLRAERAG